MAYVRMWSECHVICRRPINQRPVDSIFNYFFIPERRLFITFKGKSLSNCYCICILSCGCVGVSVRRYCCGFRSMSLKIGYRTLNCIVHFWSLILVSIFLCLGSPQNLFQVILLQLFCLLIPIWNSFVSVGILIGFLFVGMVQQTLRKLGRCQMTRLI